MHRRLFHSGFSKAQEGAGRKVRRPLRGPLGAALKSVPVAKREFIFKDLRLFFRDNTQWSQLILLAVLLLIYIFNIKSLPIHSGERIPFSLVIVISFLNLGLAGFVLAAVAARFIFPAVSLEGRQMWLLRSSPLDPEAMLWSKYWTGTVPLLVLAFIITVLTNWLLQAGCLHDGGERRHHPAVHPRRRVRWRSASASSTRSSAPRTRRRSPPASAG